MKNLGPICDIYRKITDERVPSVETELRFDDKKKRYLFTIGFDFKIKRHSRMYITYIFDENGVLKSTDGNGWTIADGDE